MHLAIAGNIGSGKTTLTGLLAKHYNYEAQYEDVDDNPYLDDFYEEMQRWSFNLQIYFLRSRFEQVIRVREENLDVIQDRTIYEDANIFAPNLHAMGLMTARDYNSYSGLFELMERNLQAQTSSFIYEHPFLLWLTTFKREDENMRIALELIICAV